ncbi:MAG TPA: hypothetical protein VK139_06605 [Microbacteriaceae bacterium]|nr:hypothetical protein [Microbacteriaceae bacterium]
MLTLASNLILDVNGIPSIVFGIVAMVLFIAAMLFVWTFRDVANRHAAKAEAWAKAHPEHAVPLNELGAPKHH